MNLFQSIFRGGESRGRYPESLIEAAIERAVEGTDARLRLLPGYRKRLRVPVIQAIDQVVALVDTIPAPLVAGRRGHGEDPRLAAVFSSAEDMLRTFGRDPALTAFLAAPEGADAERVTCLLLAERVERNILGMDLVATRCGGMCRRSPSISPVIAWWIHASMRPRCAVPCSGGPSTICSPWH